VKKKLANDRRFRKSLLIHLEIAEFDATVSFQYPQYWHRSWFLNILVERKSRRFKSGEGAGQESGAGNTPSSDGKMKLFETTSHVWYRQM
jgi:hypothetical protein